MWAIHTTLYINARTTIALPRTRSRNTLRCFCFRFALLKLLPFLTPVWVMLIDSFDSNLVDKFCARFPFASKDIEVVCILKYILIISWTIAHNHTDQLIQHVGKKCTRHSVSCRSSFEMIFIFFLLEIKVGTFHATMSEHAMDEGSKGRDPVRLCGKVRKACCVGVVMCNSTKR